MVTLGRIGGDNDDAGEPQGLTFSTAANRRRVAPRADDAPPSPPLPPIPPPSVSPSSVPQAPSPLPPIPFASPAASSTPSSTSAGAGVPPPPPPWFVPTGPPAPVPPPPPRPPGSDLGPTPVRSTAIERPPQVDFLHSASGPAPARISFDERNRFVAPVETVETGGLGWLVPVLVSVIVLGAIAVGTIVFWDQRDPGDLVSASESADRASGSILPSTTTTIAVNSRRPDVLAPPPLPVETTVAPSTVAPATTVAPPPPTAPATTQPTSPATTLRPIPLITIPPTTAPPATAPPATAPPAVAFTAPDGTFSVTLPAAPQASPPNGGISEFVSRMPSGASIIVGRDSVAVDPDQPFDDQLRNAANQIAASLSSNASLGQPFDQSGGRALDYSAPFNGGKILSRVMIVSDHLLWVTLVQPTSTAGNGEVNGAFLTALATFQPR